MIADLLPPGSVLRPQAPLALRGDIPSASNTYENTKRTAKDVQPLAALVLAFEARDVQADVVLAGPNGRKHYIAVNRPLGSRPGWQVESPDTTIDIVLGIQQEENVSARDRLTALSGISTVSLEHANCPQAAVPAIGGHDHDARNHRFVAGDPAAAVQHAVHHGHRSLVQLLFRRRQEAGASTLHPGRCAGVVCLRDRLHVAPPGVGVRQSGRLDVGGHGVGRHRLGRAHVARDGQAVYCARRRYYSELYHLGLNNASASQRGSRHHRIVPEARGRPAARDVRLLHAFGRPGSSHIRSVRQAVRGGGRQTLRPRVQSERPRAAGPAGVGGAHLLSTAMPRVLRQVAGNVEVDGSRVTVCRWCDEVSGRPLPGPVPLRDLHGLTVYVEDAQHARAWLDGEELTSFTRNAADATGGSSITFVDDSQPRVLFDEVDSAIGTRTCPATPIGWDKDVVHLDPTLEYYLRQGDCAARAALWRIALEASGTASMTVDTPTFDARDTFYLRLKYKQIVGREPLQFRHANGRRAMARGGGKRSRAGRRVGLDHSRAKPREPGTIAWCRSPMSRPASAWPSRHAAQQKIAALRFSVQGKADDRFCFDQIELLRPCACPRSRLSSGRSSPAASIRRGRAWRTHRLYEGPERSCAPRRPMPRATSASARFPAAARWK